MGPRRRGAEFWTKHVPEPGIYLIVSVPLTYRETVPEPAASQGAVAVGLTSRVKVQGEFGVPAECDMAIPGIKCLVSFTVPPQFAGRLALLALELPGNLQYNFDYQDELGDYDYIYWNNLYEAMYVSSADYTGFEYF